MERIVVGVDGSPQGQRALSWALDQARTRGAELVVVHAWDFPEGYYAVPVEMERVAADTLRRCLAEADTDGVSVSSRLIEDRPVPALLQAADGADLLVVGSRGHGGIGATFLGSVSTGCVHRASCPVTVIPPPRKDRRRHRFGEEQATVGEWAPHPDLDLAPRCGLSGAS